MAERRQVIVDITTRTSGATKGVKNLKRDVGGLTSGTKKASKSLGGLNKNTASAKRGLGSLVGGAGGAGLAMTGVGAAVLGVGAVLKGSIGAFAGFDDKMNQSVAIMCDVSEAMRKDMSDAAREMAKTTRFSAEEAAESYFFLASAGLNAEQSISALPAVAAFGQAGMFDMALATDLLTDAQSSLGLTVDDSAENLANMTRVSDVFVKANTLANTSVQQVSEAITNKLGGALRGANIDIEEGVAVLGAYADQGLKGASAGEAFNIVLRDLTKVGRTSADVLAEHNIEIFDAEGNFNNMADVIEDLEDAFLGLTVAEQAQLAADLGFQDRSFKNIRLLLGQSDAIREYEGELRKAGGTTEEVAGKQMESFSAQMGLLKSRVVDAGISLGEALAPVVLEIASGFLDMLEAIMPLISAGAKLFKVLFKFSGLALTFKILGAAGKGFSILSGLWDENARAANTMTAAVESLNMAIEDGKSPYDALADSIQHVGITGDLTAESLTELLTASGLNTTEAFDAIKVNLALADANELTAKEVRVLKDAMLEGVEASSLDEDAKKALIEEYELLEVVTDRQRAHTENLTGATETLTDADGNLVDAEGNLIDATGALIDAQGNLIDAEGNVIVETLALADALAQAEENQQSLADTMRAFADPVFAAAQASKALVEAELALIDVQNDVNASAEELADAELAVLDTTLKAQGAFDALDASGIEDQITIIMDVLGKSREEAIEFLDSLGLLDGTEIGVAVNTVYTASGTPAAIRAGGGGGGDSAAGTGREHGGPLRKGQPAIVGEAGPELFVPNQSGMVIPNNMLQGGGTTTNSERSTTINFINPNLANDPVKAIRSRLAFDALSGAA